MTDVEAVGLRIGDKVEFVAGYLVNGRRSRGRPFRGVVTSVSVFLPSGYLEEKSVAARTQVRVLADEVDGQKVPPQACKRRMTRASNLILAERVPVTANVFADWLGGPRRARCRTEIARGVSIRPGVNMGKVVDGTIGGKRVWTQHEIRQLACYWGKGTKVHTIGRRIGRSTASVYLMAMRRKLKPRRRCPRGVME